MKNYNPEMIRRLAMGDPDAYKQISTLPATERMSIGLAVNELRDRENIIPMNTGLTIYEHKESKLDENGIRDAMQCHMDMEHERIAKQEKAREEYIAEQTRLAIERSRAGLSRNGKFKLN